MRHATVRFADLCKSRSNTRPQDAEIDIEPFSPAAAPVGRCRAFLLFFSPATADKSAGNLWARDRSCAVDKELDLRSSASMQQELVIVCLIKWRRIRREYRICQDLYDHV